MSGLLHEGFVGEKQPPSSLRQGAKGDLSNSDSVYFQDAKADEFAHAPDLSVSSFEEFDGQTRRSSDPYFTLVFPLGPRVFCAPHTLLLGKRVRGQGCRATRGGSRNSGGRQRREEGVTKRREKSNFGGEKFETVERKPVTKKGQRANRDWQIDLDVVFFAHSLSRADYLGRKATVLCKDS